MKQQSSHFYLATDGGFTANPLIVPDSEIERVGLHDCSRMNCSERHWGNVNDWFAAVWKIAKNNPEPA